MPQLQKRLMLNLMIILFSLIITNGCTKNKIENTEKKLHAAVTSVTYADFVKRVGKDFVDVTILIPA